MFKKKEESDILKERLEYLFNIISGLKDVEVEYSERKRGDDLTYSSIENRKIYLDETGEYNKNKSEGFQELGHVWLSGSLKHIAQNWNPIKHGNFNEFRDIINVLEDIRTENLMSVRYPQIKNRLINLHIERLNKFLEENPDFTAKNPRAALYLHAENRFEIPIEIDPSIGEVSTKLKEIIDNSNFRDGNWKSMVITALKLCEEVKKWEDSHFKPVQDELNKMMQLVQKAQNESKELVEQQNKALKELSDIQKNKLNSKSFIDNFLKRVNELTSITNGKSKDFKEKVDSHLETLKEISNLEEKQLKQYDKVAEGLLDYVDQITKEIDVINKEKYMPAIEKQTKVADDIGKIKQELKNNFDTLPKTFIHFFENVDERKAGKGRDLTKIMIEELLRKEEKESGGFGRGISNDDEESEDEDGNPIRMPGGTFVPPPGTILDKNFPKIKVFRTSDRFVYEGYYPIPNLKLATAMGYEIASALKRELKLKSTVLKKRMYGSVDIKAIKRQMARYGMIIDPRVMKLRKKLIEKHSVMVLVDFSGSMSGGAGEYEGKSYTKVQYAKQALVTLGKTLETLNVNYSLRGFSATTSRYKICDIIMKDFEDPHMDYTTINKVFYPDDDEDNCQNRDGSSIRYGMSLLHQQRGKKLMIVISDGLPNHPSSRDSYSGSVGNQDTMNAIREVEESGAHIMGISIDPSANNFVTRAYPHSFIFNNMKMLPLQLTKTYIDTIMKRGK